MTFKFTSIFFVAALPFLAACGGGSGSSTASAPPPPIAQTPNLAPVFNSPTAATMTENSTDSFYVVGASDPDSNSSPTMSLSTAGDSAFFGLDLSTMALSPLAALDYETPADDDGDNVYNVVLTATDSEGLSESLTVAVTVTDVADDPVNLAPVFSSPTAATLIENSTDSFYVAVASDPDSDSSPTISLSEADDSAFFKLDSLTLAVSPVSPLDFELPADSDGDNIYNIVLTATDDEGLSQSLTVAVTVADIADEQAFSLDPNAPPSENFDLSTWKLQLPINEDGELTGPDNLDIGETDLNAGYEDEYFFTGADGAMVFRTPVTGATTSAGARYTRTELREMLRAGNRSISTQGVNKNNWVLSSAPSSNQSAAGGVDGVLTVTMAVNEVIQTAGENFQHGRIIIGQIHGDDDEPIRLYYRKLPGNTHGSIYAAHEIFGGDDTYFEIIGSRDNDAPNPADGIMLDQIFTYEIRANGESIEVTITKDGAKIGQTVIDIRASGYENDWMYFKAGLYQQASYANNTSGSDEVSQVSIYELETVHN